MNSRVLKVFAIVTMTLDHIGLYLLDSGTSWYFIMRAIGRIAFPLFAFFIAEGFLHTHNIRNYFLRILGYAVIIELGVLGYFLATGVSYLFEANVFWPLAVGLLSLILLKSGKWYWRLLVIGLIIGIEFLQVPYGAYGVLLIIVFGTYRQFPLQVIFFLFINLIFNNFPFWTLLNQEEYAKYPWVQWFSMLSMFLIYFYNGKLGKGSKWFFYIYYPVHLLVIFLISLWIN
ncbi:MAG: hypothetical protein JXR38_03325 [Bacilli bacterium]|nr:hypothetical protein [Bacilli bacterium]